VVDSSAGGSPPRNGPSAPPPSLSGTPGVSRGAALGATVALVALRILYAFNWFDIGPGLPAIGEEFGIGSAGWGVLLGAFFAGAALFQLPAGLLARRYGTRTITLVGAAVLGAAVVVSSFAPSFAVLVGLRFLSGAGSGLFFSPAIALVASLHPEGRRGIPVGVFSSAYTLGAGAGVLLGAVLLPAVGWRGVLAIGGLATLLLVPVAIALIPRRAGPAPAPEIPGGRGLPRAFRSRALWAIGLSFMGLEGASLSAGQYFVPFAESVHAWVPALAGGVAALFVFPSFFGGPVGGWLTEHYANRRTQLALFTAIPSALLLAIPFVGLAATALIATLFSVAFGMVYAIMYVLPPYLPGARSEELSLAIGLFNAIQLAGGALVAALAGWAVDVYGYDALWYVLGAAAILTLLALPLVPATPREIPAPPGPAACPA
jgi:predicted MFS family arabinose efflux permease